MKVNSKGKFEVRYSFLKPLSQNLEVLTQRGDVINPKLARKRTQTCISRTNGDRKKKIKSKRNFEMRYSFMKLFSGNLEIPTPYCGVIISKLGQKDSNLYIMYQISKSETIITLVQNIFLTEEFMNFETPILVVTSLLHKWNYQGKTYICCFITYELWPFLTNRTRYINLGLFWPIFRITSERGHKNGV